MNTQIKNAVKLLESLTGKRVALKEGNEAMKNLAVEALKAVSESMEMVQQNVTIALDKVTSIDSGGMLEALQQLESSVNEDMTRVSQIIAKITGMQTEESILGEELLHEDQVDDKGVEMGLDSVVKNIDDVGKIIDKDVNVIVDDEV